MKTILLIISIMIFGLYSCGDEVNNTEEKKEEIQRKDKYTIEDILADTNWVEVEKDTLPQDSRICITAKQYSDSVLKISSMDEHKIIHSRNLNFNPLIIDSATSCIVNYEIPNFDFSKYDLFLSYKREFSNSICIHKIFYNYQLNSYFYYQEIILYDNSIARYRTYLGNYYTKKLDNNSNVYFQEKRIFK